MKNKGFLITIVAIALVAVMGISSYNSLVNMDEGVGVKYNTINVMLEERYDKIPDLMETVKGMAKHEKEIINSVAEGRKMFQTANNQDEKIEAANQLDADINNLLNITVERYPEIASTQMFQNFMDEYSSTQNKITNAKLDYDQAAGKFNGKIRKFPTNIVAKMAGLESKALYQVAEGSTSKPEINFTD